MALTHKEQAVVEALSGLKVAPVGVLVEETGVSQITVARALRKHGHYSSYNLNSSYHTLRETPSFDRSGLWQHEEVRFSKHGTLKKTVRALVSSSPRGLTVEDLEQVLGVRVHNPLSALCRASELGRLYEGRHAVYVSAEREVGEQQEMLRRRVGSLRRGTVSELALPEGLDALTVIGVLIGMIECPRKASPEAVAEHVRAEGIAVTARDVRRVQEEYGLKKTTV